VGTGEKEDVKYWAPLGCCISPCYGPFSHGARFETYEPFISLNFKKNFGSRETADIESVNTGARLCCVLHNGNLPQSLPLCVAAFALPATMALPVLWEQ
jgi:hypothetical protein